MSLENNDVTKTPSNLEQSLQRLPSDKKKVDGGLDVVQKKAFEKLRESFSVPQKEPGFWGRLFPSFYGPQLLNRLDQNVLVMNEISDPQNIADLVALPIISGQEDELRSRYNEQLTKYFEFLLADGSSIDNKYVSLIEDLSSFLKFLNRVDRFVDISLIRRVEKEIIKRTIDSSIDTIKGVSGSDRDSVKNEVVKKMKALSELIKKESGYSIFLHRAIYLVNAVSDRKIPEELLDSFTMSVKELKKPIAEEWLQDIGRSVVDILNKGVNKFSLETRQATPDDVDRLRDELKKVSEQISPKNAKIIEALLVKGLYQLVSSEALHFVKEVRPNYDHFLKVTHKIKIDLTDDMLVIKHIDYFQLQDDDTELVDFSKIETTISYNREGLSKDIIDTQRVCSVEMKEVMISGSEVKGAKKANNSRELVDNKTLHQSLEEINFDTWDQLFIDLNS